MARGIIKLNNDEVERIVIIRSAVPTRDIGFLPGDDVEKLAPYEGAYENLCRQISTKMNYAAMISKGMIEFTSTSHLRGLTFDNAYVLVDEYQNMSAHELHTIATRVGQGTHLVVSGDSGQSDLRNAEALEHHSVIEVFGRMTDETSKPVFSFHRFGVEDIVRSGFVRHYYEAREA